jgi:hypothetical protein
MPESEDTQRDHKPTPDQVTVRGDAAALKQAADTLAGRRLQPGVRAFAIPTDATAYGEAIDNGAIQTLLDAGFIVCAPGTGDPALAQGEIGMCVPAGTMDAVLGLPQ